jgi:hypothetical protein
MMRVARWAPLTVSSYALGSARQPGTKAFCNDDGQAVHLGSFKETRQRPCDGARPLIPWRVPTQTSSLSPNAYRSAPAVGWAQERGEYLDPSSRFTASQVFVP